MGQDDGRCIDRKRRLHDAPHGDLRRVDAAAGEHPAVQHLALGIQAQQIYLLFPGTEEIRDQIRAAALGRVQDLLLACLVDKMCIRDRFRGDLAGRYEPAPGPCKLEGAIFTFDADAGKCRSVEQVALYD